MGGALLRQHADGHLYAWDVPGGWRDGVITTLGAFCEHIMYRLLDDRIVCLSVRLSVCLSLFGLVL